MSLLTSLAIDEPTAPNAIDPAIPVAMSDLIMQLLSKSPDKRPADAHVVSEALLAILTQAAPPIVEAMPRSGAVPMASAADATAIDPWQAIDEPDLDVTTSTPSPAQSLPESAKRKSQGKGILFGLSLVLLFVVGGGFAGYKLFFETKNGTLVVEVDGDADVRFKNGTVQIYDTKGELKYTLKPGERSKTMPPGPYKVEVAGADGVKLETNKFTMTKNGATVRILGGPTGSGRSTGQRWRRPRRGGCWLLKRGAKFGYTNDTGYHKVDVRVRFCLLGRSGSTAF